MLVDKENTPHDFTKIDLLGRQLERLHRCRKYRETGNEVDLNPNIEARNAGPKKKRRKNHLTPEQIDALREDLEAGMFGYQHTWGARGTMCNFVDGATSMFPFPIMARTRSTRSRSGGV
ncbi:uncharacterized protein YjcR [Sphingomonas zeicaulis]|uniref:hypothetical protein n=1 Tax=Sphingomonas zeicaulis TaxID=1632740 RepID=UPI003D1AA726